MGAEYSHEERAYWPGGICLTEILQAKVSVLRNFYNTMIMHHFGKDSCVDKATLTYLMPFTSGTSSQLCTIFDVNEDNVVNWKRLIGGLLLCVEGSLTEKIHLLYIVNKLSRKSVSESAMRRILTEILQATDRIFLDLGRCPDDSSVYHGNVFVNIDSIVDEIISGIYNSQKQGVTMNDFQTWAEDNSRLIESVFDCRQQRNNIQLANRNGLSNSSINKRTSYMWNQLSDWQDSMVPCFRCKHASCLYDGQVYVYGGRDMTMGLKDLWSYDIGNDLWKSIEVKDQRPTRLEGHTLVPYKGNLYMFGGEYGFGGDDETPLWIFNVYSNSWRKFKIDSEVQMPVGRRGHTAVVSHNAMHIYGGYMDLKGSTSELWTFDFDSESFHLVYTNLLTEGGAGPRHYHTAVVHGNGMWVYGGNTDLLSKNDLWKWSFSLRKWTRIRKVGPPELCGHTAAKLIDAMYIFGGETNGVQSDQLWRFHFASESWQKIETSGYPMIPRSYHTCLLITPFNVNSSIPSSDRSHSVPHLRESVDHSNGNKVPRPYSSPPTLSPNRNNGPPFKNRVSPTPSPSVAERTFESSLVIENSGYSGGLSSVKERLPGSVVSDWGDSAPLLHVKEAQIAINTGLDNPVFKSSNPSVDKKSSESLDKHLDDDICDSTSSLLDGLELSQNGGLRNVCNIVETSASAKGVGCESQKTDIKQKNSQDIFVTCRKSQRYKITDDLVQVLSTNGAYSSELLKGSKTISGSVGNLLGSPGRNHVELPGLVRTGSLQSVCPDRKMPNCTFVDDIIPGLGVVSDTDISNAGNDLYLEDIDDLDSEFEESEMKLRNRSDLGQSLHCIRSNGLPSNSAKSKISGSQSDYSLLCDVSTKNGVHQRRGHVGESTDSGYTSCTPNASEPAENKAWEGGGEELGIHSRYASTYKLGEEHSSVTNASGDKGTEKSQLNGHRPKMHGRANTAPQSLALNAAQNKPKRKPQICLPEGGVSILIMGGKEGQQKQLGLSPLPVWKCDVLQGLATPRQVQRLLQESAGYYGN